MAIRTTFTDASSGDALIIRKLALLSIAGLTAGSGTIDLETSNDDGGTWNTVEQFTADVEVNIRGQGAGQSLFRLTVSTYGSGTFVTYLG